MHPTHQLKIDLMTHGIDVSQSALEILDARYPGRPLTLADYASTSGISLELAGGVWVNAPLREHNPNFVHAPVGILEASRNGAGFHCARRHL